MGRTTARRMASARSTRMSSRPSPTAMITVCRVVTASLRFATACCRYPLMSPCRTAIDVRSASNSALPRSMAGLITGLPRARTWAIVGVAYRSCQLLIRPVTTARSPRAPGTLPSRPRSAATALRCWASPLA